MLHRTRKFIALFLLLWLPLFGTSAVAESLAMQMQRSGCPEQAGMMQHGMADHGMQHDADPASAGDSASGCNSCGICHIACTTFLLPISALPVLAMASRPVADLSQSFASRDSAPLDPPPLA